MTTRWLSRVMAVVCAGVLGLAVLAGCSTGAAVNNEEQTANREYMAKVNLTLDELSTKLDQFEEAVSRGDSVTMRTQLENAMGSLEALSKIDAPEAMKNLQEQYVSGCTSLGDALNAYVDLYTEIDTADEAHPFDYATYDDRISAIQEQYNEGLSKLQEADNAATEME